MVGWWDSGKQKGAQKLGAPLLFHDPTNPLSHYPTIPLSHYPTIPLLLAHPHCVIDSTNQRAQRIRGQLARHHDHPVAALHGLRGTARRIEPAITPAIEELGHVGRGTLDGLDHFAPTRVAGPRASRDRHPRGGSPGAALPRPARPRPWWARLPVATRTASHGTVRQRPVRAWSASRGRVSVEYSIDFDGATTGGAAAGRTVGDPPVARVVMGTTFCVPVRFSCGAGAVATGSSTPGAERSADVTIGWVSSGEATWAAGVRSA